MDITIKRYVKRFKTAGGAERFANRVRANTNCDVDYITNYNALYIVQWNERHAVNYGVEQKRIFK